MASQVSSPYSSYTYVVKHKRKRNKDKKKKDDDIIYSLNDYEGHTFGIGENSPQDRGPST